MMYNYDNVVTLMGVTKSRQGQSNSSFSQRGGHKTTAVAGYTWYWPRLNLSWPSIADYN